MSRLAEVFLDAAYAIALSASSDHFHAKLEARITIGNVDGGPITIVRM